MPINKDIPFGKMQKKLQQKEYAKQRGTWYGLNPVTRKPPNPKAYNRNKTKREIEL